MDRTCCLVNEIGEATRPTTTHCPRSFKGIPIVGLSTVECTSRLETITHPCNIGVGCSKLKPQRCWTNISRKKMKVTGGICDHQAVIEDHNKVIQSEAGSEFKVHDKNAKKSRMDWLIFSPVAARWVANLYLNVLFNNLAQDGWEFI